MTNYERNAVLISSIIAISGIASSLFFGTGGHFARSGALITIVAIVFASLDLRARLASAAPFIDEQLSSQRDSIIQKGKEKGLDDLAASALVDRVAEVIRSESKIEIERSSRRILRVELALFVVGTVIWGFGDLPIDALFPKACGCS